EWDQVAKLIKRSSLDNGINIPILFNMLVGHMTDVAVDAGDTKESENAEDTHMRLFSNPNRLNIGNGLQSSWQEYKYNYAGNLNNIGKLYTILTQFDLHAVRNSIVNPEETDVNQRRFVRRTFMGDIFPRISVANIDAAYKPSDHDRVENSAKTTGVIEEMEAFSEGDRNMYNKKAYRSRVRVLCQENDDKNEQFESNPMYLWNRFTFYPYDVVTEDDQRAVLNSSDMNNEMKIRFLEWGYLESFYAGATNSYPIFQKQSMDQSLRRRVGTDGTDGQNVYVLHWPNKLDNENASQSLLGNWGEPPGQTNNLLNMAYKIMGYPGKARAVEIKARPRNKVYTLMGRDEGTFTDHVMLDYYTTRNLYTPEELIRLDTEEKNIMISAFNPNSEPAFITSITLHRSYEENDTGDGDTGGNTGQGDNTSGNTSGVSGDEGDDEDDGNETDTGNGEAVPLIMVGDDTPGGTPIDLGSVLKKDNATNVEVETNYAVDGQTKTGERIQQGQGILINPTKTLYFHIPYTLKDFFEKRVENGEEIGGYDKIVIYGYYYTKNQKDHTMSIVGMKDVINISERELFDLE
ncbi:MAG: hypothetical protein J6P16_02260, partial [Eubacterium sp.]|nr:hypothetical protein [Eubacterium sp.]